MYQAITVAGLVGLATAAYSQAPPAGYETSSSAAAVYSSEPAAYSSAPAGYESSAPAAYTSSAPAAYSSSAPAAYSSSAPAAYSSSAPAVYSSISTSYVASSASYYASSSSSAPTAYPTPACWSKCFDENDITSEADLCGNTAVNECIYYGCCQEDDMKYWNWYNAYCPAPSSPVSSSSTVPSSPVTYSVPSSTSSVPSATPTGNCWNACFEQFDVESEADLCGNDDVSKCIAVTCSSDLDKAYWEWYNGYCASTTSTTVITSVCTPTSMVTYPATSGETTATWGTEPFTTTYVSTTSWATPVESSPATTGWPSAPAPPAGSAPPAYTSPVWTAPYSYPVTSPATAASTGYGASPTPSGWVPVAATGAGAANKPAGLIAAVLAVAAYFL